jgi:MFS superfamily sulfate permease-like transporter
MKSEKLRKWMAKHWYVQLIALIFGVLLLLILMCSRQIVRKVPVNYAALFTFTAIWSYVVASICAFTSP